MTPVSTIRRPNALTDGTVPTVHQDSPCVHNKKPARNRCIAVPSRLVVCARWCPTLPHPGGCSTIGAVRLSFRVRDGAGRFPVAVTTETAVGSAVWCRLVLLIRLCGCLPSFAAAHLRLVGVVWLGGWVGCGPYSGRFALSCCLPHPAPVVRWVGGCCLCRPISTSQLPTVTGLPLLAYQPSSLLGAYQEGRVLLVETLS